MKPVRFIRFPQGAALSVSTNWEESNEMPINNSKFKTALAAGAAAMAMAAAVPGVSVAAGNNPCAASACAQNPCSPCCAKNPCAAKKN